MNEEIITTKKLSKKKLRFLRIKRKIFKHVWVLRATLLILGITAIYLTLFLFNLVIQKTKIPFYLRLTRDFVFVDESKIKSFEGRTNILLLGKGGVNHQAGDLTDTIIFVSIFHPSSPSLTTLPVRQSGGKAGSRGVSLEPEVTLISLPRDIWITELRTKLNSIYYWGNQKKQGGGLVLAKSTVEQIVGEPVHYALVLDFEGFIKVIDVLEGIEIDVERSFIDEKYPISGRENDDCDGDPEYKCRYQTVEFGKGTQIMDGNTALQYVRSRNATGDEGTDFARAERQQKVIKAVEKKVFSGEVLLSPKKIIELKNILSNYLETDVDSSAAAILARRIWQLRNSINSHLLPESLLLNPPDSPLYDNLYVFIPKVEDWSEVHNWVSCILEKRDCF